MIDRSIDDGIFELRIDRPEVKNAISLALLEELADALGDLDSSEHDVCVLTGNGDAFSAGGDIKAMAERDEDPLEAYERLQGSLNTVIERMVTAGVPIVARVNGDAIGAGANLAFSADFVIARTDARFGEPFVHVGLVPDGGGTVFLPYEVGLRTAKELAMTGRLFDAAEAAELGLINEAVPPDELDPTVSDLVADLADRPTEILGLTKRLFHENLGRPFRDGLDREAHFQTLAYSTDAHSAGVRRFLQE